jgi:hypothetical protein
MLLLSQSDLDYCGRITLTVQRWAKCSPDTTAKSVIEDLHELDDHRFVIVDFDTEEALVRSFIRNDGVTKLPNVFRAALNAAHKVQSARLRRVLATELRRIGRENATKVADEIDAVDNPVDNVGGLAHSIAHNTNGLTDGEDEDKPAGHIDPLFNSLSIAPSSAIESEKLRGRGRGKGKGIGVGVGASRARTSARGDPDFEAFYAAYPRKSGRIDAEKAWLKAIKDGAAPADVIAGAKRYADDPGRKPDYTKHPATWLNKGCWMDEPSPPSGYQAYKNPDPSAYYGEL